MKFLNLKQEGMTVTKVVRKFEKLEQLCPFIKLCKEERVHRLMEVFQPDIAMSLGCRKQPTTLAKCYERALRAEFRLGYLKEEEAKVPKTREKKTKWKRIVDQEQ